MRSGTDAAVEAQGVAPEETLPGLYNLPAPEASRYPYEDEGRGV